MSKYVEVFRYAVVIGKEYDDIFKDKKPSVIERIRIMGKITEIVEDVVFSMFLENIKDKGRYLAEEHHEEHIITTIVLFDKDFYDKHIGRLIKEEMSL